jgi:hypothetical protein
MQEVMAGTKAKIYTYGSAYQFLRAQTSLAFLLNDMKETDGQSQN